MGIFTHLFRLPRQGRGTGVLIKCYYGSGAFIVTRLFVRDGFYDDQSGGSENVVENVIDNVVDIKERDNMATEKMYDLAFQYKGTKLWQQLYEDEMFAVQLPDGEIGYCSTMGRMGDHLSLALYVGDSGYQSCRYLAALSMDYEKAACLEEIDILSVMDCLECQFTTKDMLSNEEAANACQYAAAREKSMRGKNAFPLFTKYSPGRVPWHVYSELDESRLCEALSAAIALKSLLRKNRKEQLGLRSLLEEPDQIPMLVRKGDTWMIRLITLPSSELVYPAPVFANEVLAAHIKRKTKRGIWECRALYLPSPVQEEDNKDAPPYYPLMLAFMDVKSEMMIQPIIASQENAETMMNSFAEEVFHADASPKTIHCGDERSYSILKDFCAKTGIRLEMRDELKHLDEALDAMQDDLSENGEPILDQLEEYYAFLTQMSDAELLQMPRDLVNMLLSLGEAGELPEALKQRVRKLFHK